MVTCGICHEEHLTEIGKLDSCDHSFCSACIQQWAEIESRCPFCKARFSAISRKTLDLEKLPDSDAESDDTLRQKFPGTVLQTLQIPERNQVYLGDAEWDGDEGEDPLGDVMCMECGQGDDEDNLMLCDGCERACHTYCANLDALPEGDWYCWVCMENRDREQAGEEPVNTAAQRPQRTPRSSLVASDFILPRSRRRASSPGARSERSTRRVRRRLVRSGDRLQLGRSGSGSQRPGSDADSILNALERSISARDHAGLSTTAEHRRLAGLRGAWNSVRQGQRPFPSGPNRLAGPSAQIPATAPQADDPESQAWAAFDASRRAHDRTARQATRPVAAVSPVRAVMSSPEHIAPASPVLPRQQTASSLARQAIAEARSRGRQLGPSYRGTRPSPPRHTSSLTATVASQRRREADRQLDRQFPLPASSSAHQGSRGHAGRRTTHAAGRGSMHERSSSLMQREAARGSQHLQRQQLRDPQPPPPPFSLQQPPSSPRLPPSSPRRSPSSPRLRGADNATDTANGSASMLPPSYSSQPSLVPAHRPSDRFQAPSDSIQSQDRYSSALPNLDQHSVYQHHVHHHPVHQQSVHQHPVHQQLPGFGSTQRDPSQTAGNHNEMQQPQQQLPFDQPSNVPRQHPFPETSLAPSLPLRRSMSVDSAVGHSKQAAAYAGRGEDSSDSSSSQLASQQRSVRVLPRHAAAGAAAAFGGRSRAQAGKMSANAAGNLASPEQLPSQVRAAAAGEPGTEASLVAQMTKQQAANAVKSLMKPLYAANKLSKEQFKAVAQGCTHALAGSSRQSGRTVRQIVREALLGMGLGQAAAQV